jgi:hypothetical protein
MSEQEKNEGDRVLQWFIVIFFYGFLPLLALYIVWIIRTKNPERDPSVGFPTIRWEKDK